MTTTEVAAVVVAGASVVGVMVLALFLARLNRTVRDVGARSSSCASRPCADAQAELQPAPSRP